MVSFKCDAPAIETRLHEYVCDGCGLCYAAERPYEFGLCTRCEDARALYDDRTLNEEHSWDGDGD